MRRTEKAALVSAVASATLAGGMVAVSVITGSVAVLAKAVDTIADTVTSVTVMVGLRVSEKHTETFPLGLHKLENLIATAIGVLILFGAYELGREAIGKIAAGSPPIERPSLVVIVMSVAVVVSALLAWYKGKVGTEANSPSLRADGRQSWADVLAGLVVILGISLEMAGVRYMDSAAALVVVFFLVWAGGKVAVDGLKVLLDASIEREVLDRVRQIALDDPCVKRVATVQGRNSGSYRFLHLAVVPTTTDLREAKVICGDLRAKIEDEIENVDEITVDLEAETPRELTGAIALEDDGEAVSAHFGEAESFELVTVDVPRGEILSSEMVSNPFADMERGKGVRLSEYFIRRGVEAVVTREPLHKKGAYYALESHNVKLISGVDTRKEAGRLVAEYARKLRPLVEDGREHERPGHDMGRDDGTGGGNRRS